LTLFVDQPQSKMEWSGTQMVRSRIRGFVYSAAQVGSRSSHAFLHRCYARKRLQGVGSFVCQVVPAGNPRHVGVHMAKAKPNNDDSIPNPGFEAKVR
jgi:hypothetical protein